MPPLMTISEVLQHLNIPHLPLLSLHFKLLGYSTGFVIMLVSLSLNLFVHLSTLKAY